MTDDKFQISRRKALAGLATIGAAGAGAGLGTSAYFSDEESFTGNTITAGTLDMSVTASVEAANDYWAEQVDLAELEATADGEAVTGLQVEDVKPGDWGIICFDIDIADNPGYVQVSTANLESNENGYTEPEEEDDNDEGELDDAILATVWDGLDGNDRTGLSGLDGTTNVAGSSESVGWTSDRDEGGVVTEDEVHYTTLQEAHDEYETGVTLGGLDSPDEVGSGEESEEFCLLLEIPSEVGNEIQGDEVSFDLIFNTEQVRNNDDPFSDDDS